MNQPTGKEGFCTCWTNTARSVMVIFDYDLRQNLTAIAVRPVPAEGMNRSRARYNFPGVRRATGNEVFPVPDSTGICFPVDNERVAALHDQHLLVIVVNVGAQMKRSQHTSRTPSGFHPPRRIRNLRCPEVA